MALTQKYQIKQAWRVTIAAAFAVAGVAAFAAPVAAAPTSADKPPGAATAASGSTGSAAGMPDSTSAVTVTIRSGPAGTHLADGTGRTLYLFEADKPDMSNCAGTCVQFWPPLTTMVNPTAGPGVAAGMLSTIKRSDGSLQVEFDRHPLYLFSEDAKPGDTFGEGVNGSGALWWIVGPSGSAITNAGTGATPAPAPAAPSTNTGGY